MTSEINGKSLSKIFDLDEARSTVEMVDAAVTEYKNENPGIDPSSDEIIRNNIDRANRLLDKLEGLLDNDKVSARLVEVAAQLINSVTQAASQLMDVDLSLQNLDIKRQTLDIKKLDQYKGKGNITNNIVAVSTREDLMKFLEQKTTKGETNDEQEQ